MPVVLACKMEFAGIFPKNGGQSVMLLYSPLPKTTAKPVEASDITLRPATPLYDAMMKNVSEMEGPKFNELMAEIRQRFVWGDVQYIDSFGNWTDKAVPFPVKFEMALQVAKEQRDKMILLHKNLGDDTTDQAVLTKEDLTNVMNSWRKDIKSWMRSSLRKT